MRKTFAVAVTAALLTSQTGCLYHHVFHVNAGEAETFSKDWGWSHHLFGGLINVSGTTYANGICPNGVAEVDDYISFWNVLVSALTAFIWTPSTWRVFCVAPDGKRTEREITINPTPEAVARAQRMFPQEIAAMVAAHRAMSIVADAK